MFDSSAGHDDFLQYLLRFEVDTNVCDESGVHITVGRVRPG